MEEHAQHVRQVIDKLTDVNLILNPDKCHFAQRAVYLLGFCVSEKGLSLDTRKVTNVQQWPLPSTGNDIERFLGVINYFREHIPKVSTLTAPLDRLRKAKHLGALWTPECDQAFSTLKAILTRTPIIKHPRTNEPFYVATDASNVGIGAVLFQLDNKVVRHLGFFARTLSKSERNYSTTKRELLAVIFALNKFHKFLWGNHFTLFTDHRALVYIHTQRIANPMMIGWLDTLLQYNFTVAHIPGMSNVLPDALSRLFPPSKELAGDDLTQQRRKVYQPNKLSKLTNAYELTTVEQNQKRQDEKDLLEPKVDDQRNILRMYHRQASIYLESHIEQPEQRQSNEIKNLDERQTILERQHAFGHFGADAMTKAIQRDGMHWPNLKQDAVNMIKKCNLCMQFNVAKKGYHPLASITAKLPGDHWAIDLAGPLDQTTRARAIPDKRAVVSAI
ncbi:hypothetical protein [Absidia glauca]|uniref:Reverse transcriptase/retrotransposon-derived protein RNase H-like domain-containing protein n=1 Tax=Absidia glauca TaxID=4829 RepID=A0A163IZH0_ABSGL|nr:hypothetical protein [Absidia glauca]